jgi:diguanylate cyclase (GGDEF)-like protein/PAS domain S-box-containing protein
MGTHDTPRWDETRLRAFAGDAVLIARDERATLVPLPRAIRERRPPAVPGVENTALDFIHPRDRGEIVRLWTRSLQRPGVEFTGRARVLLRDGWHHHEVTIVNLLDVPEARCVLSRLIDLGSAADTEITDDEAGGGYHQPVWTLTLLDQAGQILRIDGMVDEILGRPREEVVGTSVVAYLHDDDLPASLEMWSDLLADPGGTRTIRQRVVHPDGSHVWIESTVMNRLDDPIASSIVSLAHDITERRMTEELLRREAETDPLTGVANRRQFDDRLADAIAGESDIVLLFVDLDDFKQVNDEHGHAIGDELLTIVAQRLVRAVRPGDLVARYGGDEFVVLCPAVPNDHEVDIVDRLRQVLQHPATVGTVSWLPEASIGVVRVQQGETPREVMRRADEAMYKAKQRPSSPPAGA